MASNVITAKFCADQTRAWTDELWQYDYGQILKFDGLELPDAYEVHFGNQPLTGETITQIGNADGVTIPDEYLQTGENVYAWIYLHEGEDDGETEYMITMPVSKRPEPSDEQPTPVEQRAIDQAIAALNTAVNKAEDIADEWESMTATAETLSAGSEATASYSEGVLTLGIPKGDSGDDGTSPTVTVTDITGGHMVTITDAEGSHAFSVMDGSPGTPGVSPTVTVTDITDGHRITITDAQSTHIVDVMDGAKGDPGDPGTPGNGIASIIKTGTSGLVDTYTITYTDGTSTTFTVTNGAQGDPGDDYVLTNADKVEISEMVQSMFRVTVTGTDPVITGEDNHMYLCGTVSTITINAPATGTIAVRFTSGTSVAILTATGVVWPEYFDPTDLEANTVYELNISDRYGVYESWPV